MPLNDALASVKPDSPEGATLWARYLTDWTFWNHVRTIAALAAAALFTIMPLK
ncbi:anthrone oxygenase family protein [Myxacorys almedinensis]|uniref:anthrone oxygenase family protein n=1 Tax=Myxacorys almedinensis TaxID=2651157 RepID=UPI0030839AAF